METVTFYSYTGGVGRTQLLAKSARSLAMSGHAVVALDLNFETPGLHYKLGNEGMMGFANNGKLHGAVDELLDILTRESERNQTIDSQEIKLPIGTNGSLKLIPAGSAPSNDYWTALEKLNRVLRNRWQYNELPEAVLELQARIEYELNPDFLLIDSRSGVTELGGLATSLLADRVVCVTGKDQKSVDGTRAIVATLHMAPRLLSQQPLKIEVTDELRGIEL